MSDTNGNPRPDLDEAFNFAFQEQDEKKHFESVMKFKQSIMEAKGKWLRAIMEQVLPPEIFALGESKEPKEKAKLWEYLTAKGIRVNDLPHLSQVVMGSKEAPVILGEFRVVREGNKYRVEQKIRRKE
jgi:hypothetical protein